MNLSTGFPLILAALTGMGVFFESPLTFSLRFVVDFFFAEDDDLSVYIFYEAARRRKRTA